MYLHTKIVKGVDMVWLLAAEKYCEDIHGIFISGKVEQLEESLGNSFSYMMKCECIPMFCELGFGNIALLNDCMIITQCIGVVIQWKVVYAIGQLFDQS